MPIKQKGEMLKKSAMFVALFSLLAHGYRFYNNSFSGDSLLTIYQNDSAWQIALGRIFQPIYLMVRGTICNPWLISFITIIFIAMSVFLMADLLQITDTCRIGLIAGLLVCNITWIASNATYLPWVDIYAVALFLSVLGVWLINANNRGLRLLGILAIAGVLGLYQAYICVSIGLVMITLIMRLSTTNEGKTRKSENAKVIEYVISFLVVFIMAAVLYFVMWKLFQKVFGIWTSDSYNGLAGLGDYSGVSIGSLLVLTYKMVIDFFVNPVVFKALEFRGGNLSFVWIYVIRIVNLFFLIGTALLLIKENLKNKTPLINRVVNALIFLAFPIGINFVCLLSKGMVHQLMMIAFVLVYMPLIVLCDKSKVMKALAIAGAGIIIWNNIVVANQVYLKKELQYEAAMGIMGEISSDIEHSEGYEVGETPVAFVGSFQLSDNISDIVGLEDVGLIYSMGKTSFLYAGTDYAYLNYVLNKTMNLTHVTVDDRIAAMPCYPKAGYIDYVDDVLIVKISN